MTSTIEALEQLIQDQYTSNPYPGTAIEENIEDVRLLYAHSLINAFYLRDRRVIDVTGKKVLDVGCGTGLKTALLAKNNAGVEVVGVDISEKALEVGRERALHHGLTNVRFEQCSIASLGNIGKQFDYINCDDTLYLHSNPGSALKALAAVLKPRGIIRANLHSSLQRRPFLCAQEVFKMMGIMNKDPGDEAVATVRNVMNCLDDKVVNKVLTWDWQLEDDKTYYLMNYLIQGDQGYDIRQLFQFLRAGNLKLISMTNWAEWDPRGLFQDYELLEQPVAEFINGLAGEESLRIFELLNPIHRLLDFWCGHDTISHSFKEIDDWSSQEWDGAKIYLQPQLKTEALKNTLEVAIKNGRPFEIKPPFAIPQSPLFVDSATAAWMLCLWKEPQYFVNLVKHWQVVKPINPLTLLPDDEATVRHTVIQTLLGLESLSYVLIEKSLVAL